MVFAFEIFGVPLFGLFSAYYEGAPWTWGKLSDLLKHLWIPVIVVGINGTAGLMRIMRGNLLDVLGQPFVQTARAKGLKEIVVVRETCRANCDQSTHQYFRDESTRHSLRFSNCLYCIGITDSRTDSPEQSAERGHLPCGDVNYDVEPPFSYRQPDRRHSPRLGRSEDSL